MHVEKRSIIPNTHRTRMETKRMQENYRIQHRPTHISLKVCVHVCERECALTYICLMQIGLIFYSRWKCFCWTFTCFHILNLVHVWYFGILIKWSNFSRPQKEMHDQTNKKSTKLSLMPNCLSFQAIFVWHEVDATDMRKRMGARETNICQRWIYHKITKKQQYYEPTQTMRQHL